MEVVEYYFDFLDGLPGKGPVPAELAVVGIAPSTKRPAHRKLEPFGASAWELVQQIRSRCPSLYITNLIKEPLEPGTKPTAKQIEYWLPILKRELKVVSPKRVLTVGEVVAKHLCPGFVKLWEDHGTFFWNSELGFWVVPTYHFAAVFREPGLRKYLARDLARFLNLDPPRDRDLYVLIENWELPPKGSRVVLDIETTGLELGAGITQIGYSWRKDRILIKTSPTDEELREFVSYLKHAGCTVVGHNLAFDVRVLYEHTGILLDNLEDSMILAHLKGVERLGLKHLTTMYTDLPGPRSGGGTLDPLYLAEDIRSTREVANEFLESRHEPIYPVLVGLIPWVVDLRVRGVKISRERLIEITEETERAVKELEAQWAFNPNSPRQVAEYLASKGVPLHQRTPTGSYSVSEQSLAALREQYPEVDAILDHREKRKLLSGFCYPYLELSKADGRLHPELKLTGTATGRLSCENPNLQQVPRQGPLKQVFIPEHPEGFIGLLDLSQAELRTACLLSGDRDLLKALLSEDVHLQIASMLFGIPPQKVTATQRKLSKRVTFGLLYGGTPGGIAKKSQLQLSTVDKLVKTFFARFKRLSEWMQKQSVLVQREGRITSPFGRIRAADIQELIEEGDERAALRRAVNTPIQSCASDIMLSLAHQLFHSLPQSSRMLFGIHDSLLFDIAPDDLEIVKSLIRKAFKDLDRTPLSKLELYPKLPIIGEFTWGKSWAEVESTNESYAPLGTMEVDNVD